jgi:hypothetical protein
MHGETVKFVTNAVQNFATALVQQSTYSKPRLPAAYLSLAVLRLFFLSTPHISSIFYRMSEQVS